MHEFLLEIGFEEIPASFLKPAAQALEQTLRAWFQENRIACGPSRSFFTPRRLAVRFQDIAECQQELTMEVQGPPRKAAFDAQGLPTKTAQGFARTHGKELTDLKVRTTPKGEYVFVTKTITAQPAATLLAAALPEIISRLPFPKNMRWTESGFRFARPIRWLVALLEDRVVPFTLAGVAVGNETFGHRLARPDHVALSRPDEYEAALERLSVIADPARRRQEVLTRIQGALEPFAAGIIPDDELLDETTNLVEAPKPVVCRFQPGYLGLPAIVVVTALKKHQRCFSVHKRTGAQAHKPEPELMPLFVAVTNTPDCDEKAVQGWYEKAAESRLKDASFFIAEDRKVGLEGFVRQESSVTWLEGMGTLLDKTRRLERLCEQFSSGVTGINPSDLNRAAHLCKADLLTNMVREKEYTSLQGIIGGVYAALECESERASQAIAEHYQPRSVGDPLPSTPEGCALSICDKLDNIAAAFRIGEIPTGSEDPLALRRQATGVLAILLESHWRLDLRHLLSRSLSLLPGASASDSVTLYKLHQFFKERLRLLFEDRGVSYDVANAVLETNWSRPSDALHRVEALAQFRQKAEFEALVVGQKRVANILRGAEGESPLNTELLKEPAEQALAQAAQALEPGLRQSVLAQDYVRALEQLLSLRTVIDRFFDDVMVMCEDRALSANRLALLSYVNGLFLSVADLSQIVIETKG